MPVCFHKRVIKTHPKEGEGQLVRVPCGKCLPCRINHAMEWASRCEVEAMYYEGRSCFVTLTVSPENMKFASDGKPTLDKKVIQDFMKRLRISIERKYSEHLDSFYAVGEYGSKRGRPHYHALLFGFRPHDLEFYKPSYSGYPLYKSKFIQDCWQQGLVFVGDGVNAASAGYCARYIQKKLKTSADSHFIKFTTANNRDISAR